MAVILTLKALPSQFPSFKSVATSLCVGPVHIFSQQATNLALSFASICTDFSHFNTESKLKYSGVMWY